MGYSACPAPISASMFSRWRRRRAIPRNCRQAWSRGSTRRITAYRQLRPSPTAATSHNRALHGRRRFRQHHQPAPARGPGPWRDRLQIKCRAADDLEHIGGGGLLLQRFAQFVEQAGVLNGNDRLSGEIANHFDLLIREWPYLLAID